MSKNNSEENTLQSVEPLLTEQGHYIPANKVDLNEQLIKNPTATFFLRAASEALNKSGIFKEDLLMVDRSAKPISGDIVIAELEGELSIRHYAEKEDKIVLSTDYSHIEFLLFPGSQRVPLWGVVKTVIHSL